MNSAVEALITVTAAKHGVYDHGAGVGDGNTICAQSNSVPKPIKNSDPTMSDSNMNVKREKGPVHKIEESHDTKTDWVTWDNDNDPLNPKNWSTGAKWTVTLIFSAYDLVTLLSSSMIAPALDAISRDLGIHNTVETQIVFSAFILASALGPLIFSPLSEMYGRKIIVQSANSFFLIWTIVCGFAKTKSVMIVGRVLSGFGASVVFGISVGVTADCWRPEERGRSLAILNFAPLLGPALGPILGGLLTQYTTWPWIFWSIVIFDGALQVFATFFLEESYGPVILSRKAANLRRTTGNLDLRSEHDNILSNPTRSFSHGFLRPWKIVLTHRACMLLLLHGSINFGVLYITLSTYSSIWINVYNQSETAAGLHYLALVLGFTIGTQSCSFLMDKIYQRVSRKKVPRPEIRMYLIIPGAALMFVGLLVYGWAVQVKAHWILPDIGVVIFGLGSQCCITSVAAYFADFYGLYTASALAGSMSIRSIFAFCFPMFAPNMYTNIGYGPGNTLLGSVSLILGIGIPIVVLKFGEKWRLKDACHI